MPSHQERVRRNYKKSKVLEEKVAVPMPVLVEAFWKDLPLGAPSLRRLVRHYHKLFQETQERYVQLQDRLRDLMQKVEND